MFHRPTMYEYMEQMVEADTVLYAVGSKEKTELVEELRAWDGWELCLASSPVHGHFRNA